MSHADEVRAYCTRRYVQAARSDGQKEFSIRVGDVHDALGYKNRLPLVCSALGATKFCEANGIKRTAVEGPLNGSTTISDSLLFERDAAAALSPDLSPTSKPRL